MVKTSHYRIESDFLVETKLNIVPEITRVKSGFFLTIMTTCKNCLQTHSSIVIHPYNLCSFDCVLEYKKKHPNQFKNKLKVIAKFQKGQGKSHLNLIQERTRLLPPFHHDPIAFKYRHKARPIR